MIRILNDHNLKNNDINNDNNNDDNYDNNRIGLIDWYYDTRISLIKVWVASIIPFLHQNDSTSSLGVTCQG